MFSQEMTCLPIGPIDGGESEKRRRGIFLSVMKAALNNETYNNSIK